MKKHCIHLFHFEKNSEKKMKFTISVGVSVCVFGPQQSRMELLEVLELTHSREH